MRLILVTGGARSGKSHYAERRAQELAGESVTYLATATPGDPEMAAKIERHRSTRNPAWSTIEAPRRAGEAIARATTPVVLLDCITMLASNAMLAQTADDAEDLASAEAAVASEISDLLAAAAHRDGTLIVVTNEVGLGIVPHTQSGRWYRDLLGTANCRLAVAAAEVVLMASGIPVVIKNDVLSGFGAP